MKTVATKEIAEVLDLSKKSILERARKEHWQYMKKKGAMLWLCDKLPAEVQLALIQRGKTLVSETKEPVTFLQATNKERKKAALTAGIINFYKMSNLSVENFCIAFNSGKISAAYRAEYGKELSNRTLYRWLKDFTDTGLSGITPLYSKSGKESGTGSSLTATEKEMLQFFYLDYNKRSIRHCFLSMKANIKESKATYATCRRYLKSLPEAMVDFYQLSQEAFEAKHFPYIERDKKLLKAMDQVQGDHHRIDRVVMHNGKLVIPWITTFADVRSGAILGWCVSINPNSQTILAAYYMMIMRFGIPEMVHVDNGKDYKGKTIKGQKIKMKAVDKDGIEHEEEVIITGAIVTCGSRLQYARAYHGQSKGVQERFYKILEEYYSKNTGNYIGSNTAARVDEQKLYWRAMKGKAKRNDVGSWEDFIKEITYWVNWYNTEWVSEAKDREGLTPEQAFIQNMPEAIRKPDPATVQLALTRGELRTVRENGVSVGGADYWAEELIGLTAQQVIVRVNLTNRNEALICNNKGQLLCKAYADVFMETGNMEKDNEFVNRVRRDIRQKVKEQSRLTHLTTKPKNMLEIAMEATGVEIPRVEQYIPQIEEEPKAAGAEDRQINKGKYQNYFNIDEEAFICATDK